MNGQHDESVTSSSTDPSPSKGPATPKGLPSLNGKHQDSSAKAKADSRNSSPRQGTQAHSDALKALEGTVNDLRVCFWASSELPQDVRNYRQCLHDMCVTGGIKISPSLPFALQPTMSIYCRET